MTGGKLREWQGEALAQAIRWLVDTRLDRHFLINAAPGSGKTICASAIARKLFELGEIDRVIVIAPRTEVVRQWSDEYQAVTGRRMMKVTGADEDAGDFGLDLCATWTAIQGLKDAFQRVCASHKTLIICDEHHHAAVQAAWGEDADSAFKSANYVLVLTGTPIRSDGRETVWFAYDDEGRINHPPEGTYTLSYGKAVSLGYCRPITFHRHEGRFSVKLPDGADIAVSGTQETELGGPLKGIRGLQQALDYYRLACTPKYLADGQTPDLKSYQASMLEWGIVKLDEIRERIPNAGGLVIAPSIPVAKYMAALLEQLDGEKPVLVHSEMPNPDQKIQAFKSTNKRWIVSVAMISEGVDIKRLRILVYLPNAKTELAFRQAMGRVVRTLGVGDHSRAYVVMPTHRIFEEYARRVEREMQGAHIPEARTTKICPVCEAENDKDARNCVFCEHEFPSRKQRFKTCDQCEGLSPIGAKECQHCGASFEVDFDITLNEALRLGAIVRGMDVDEEDVQEGERIGERLYDRALEAGDEVSLQILSQFPKEGIARFLRLAEEAQRSADNPNSDASSR